MAGGGMQPPYSPLPALITMSPSLSPPLQPIWLQYRVNVGQILSQLF